MNAPRDPDVLVQAFLAEGETELPDRAFDAVRRDIHTTRQRVVIGPWKELNMSTFTRVAIAAAAVVAVGFAWFSLGPPSPRRIRSAPSPSPSPSATDAQTATPTQIPALTYGPLEPGQYRLNPDLPMVITVPAGWAGFGNDVIIKNEATSTEVAFAVWDVVNTYVDPCTNHTLVSPAPGPGVEDIADALANQPGIEAGPPRDVGIDGYDGKLVELTITTDITTCPGHPDGFWLWYGDGDRRFVQGTNEQDRIYILDVDGTRFTFAAAVQQATSAADRAELEAIIESIDIRP